MNIIVICINNDKIGHLLVYLLLRYLWYLTDYTFNKRQQKLSWLCDTGLLTYLREQLHKYGAIRKSVEEARQDSIWAYPTRLLSLPADFIRLICAHKFFLQLLATGLPSSMIVPLFIRLYLSFLFVRFRQN